MIILYFGCDRCGALEERDVTREAQDWIKIRPGQGRFVPSSWIFDGELSLLLCSTCGKTNASL